VAPHPDAHPHNLQVMPTRQIADRLIRPVLRSPYVAALVVAVGGFFLGMAVLYASRAWPTGDEPHYLVISQTLLKYHSLDVATTYHNRDYLSFYDGTLDLSHTVTNSRGLHVPVHGVGGPILWLPLFAVAGRMGAILFTAGVSLLVIVDIFRLMHEQGIRKTSAVAVAGFFAAATPFFAFAHLTFVDLLGAWAVIHLLRKTIKEGALRKGDLVSSSLLVGILPWVHVKFVVVEALLLLFLLVKVVADNRAMPARAIPRAVLVRWREVCWAVLPAAVLGLGFELFTHAMWGSFDPVLAYGQGDRTFPLTASPVRGLTGTFLDQEYGIFITAPILMLAIPGFVLAVRDRVGPLNLYFTLLAVCYLPLFVARYDWEGGWTPPGRFILVLLPVFAYYIGYLLDQPNRPLAWPAFWVLGALGTAYNLLSLQSPNHGFSSGVGQNQTIVYAQQLFLQRSIAEYLPSTVKEIDYTKIIVWGLIVAVVSGLALLKLPLAGQNLSLPGVPRRTLER
jgi:hypothetical protein